MSVCLFIAGFISGAIIEDVDCDEILFSRHRVRLTITRCHVLKTEAGNRLSFFLNKDFFKNRYSAKSIVVRTGIQICMGSVCLSNPLLFPVRRGGLICSSGTVLVVRLAAQYCARYSSYFNQLSSSLNQTTEGSLVGTTEGSSGPGSVASQYGYIVQQL